MDDLESKLGTEISDRLNNIYSILYKSDNIDLYNKVIDNLKSKGIEVSKDDKGNHKVDLTNMTCDHIDVSFLNLPKIKY